MAWADVPAPWSFEDVYTHLLRPQPSPLLLRGCPPPLRAFLVNQGWHALPVGTEALIPFHPVFQPRASLRALVRRGLRHGEVSEIGLVPQTVTQLYALSGRTRYGHLPHLRYMFRGDPSAAARAFVFVARNGTWLGALTLTAPAPGRWHTELILRDQSAPVGVMEALILETAARLREEGASGLSLGETPFHFPEPVRLTVQGQLLQQAGKRFRFAYPADGLFRFKQKFAPQWETVYLCASGRITLLTLAELFRASNCHRLLGAALRDRARHWLPGPT